MDRPTAAETSAKPFAAPSSELEAIYATRFGPRRDDRAVLWETLVEHCFQRYIGPSDTVLDLAAGYCEFINNIRCGAKIAVDLNPTITTVAGPDVRVVRTSRGPCGALRA